MFHFQENILLKKKGSVHHAAVTDFGGSCFMRYGGECTFLNSHCVFIVELLFADIWYLKQMKHCRLSNLMNLFPTSSSTDQPLIYTLYYKSPEVFLGQVYNTASDMWSLGCILAELMRGHPLFCGDNNAEHFSSIMKVMLLRDNSACKTQYFIVIQDEPL